MEWRQTGQAAWDAAAIQGMEFSDLQAELRKNTYRESTGDGSHKAGDPHKGKALYVNMIKTELQKR